MERRHGNNPGSGTRDSRPPKSSISINNNTRRSPSKSPLRPKTQSPAARYPGQTGTNNNTASRVNANNISSVPSEVVRKSIAAPAANKPKARLERTPESNFNNAQQQEQQQRNSDRVDTLLPPPGGSRPGRQENQSPYFDKYSFFKPTVNPVNIPRNISNPVSTSVVSRLGKSALSLVKNQSSITFRASVEKAVREHKVYTIVGCYPAVKNALKRRGWVEKAFSLHQAARNARSQNQKDSETPARGSEEESDQAWLLRVLKDYPPDFLWVIRRDNIDWRIMNKEQIINRYPKAFFTTKVGIAACLQNIHWYSEPGVAEILFPRCYRLCFEEEKQAFIEDYRLTACFALLKLFVQTYESEGESGFNDGSSRMTTLNIEFAIRQINNFIKMRRHEDIDWLVPPAMSTPHWEAFLINYYDIVQGKQRFNWTSSHEPLRAKVDTVRRLNQRAALYWPQYHIDGYCSLWICKPGARSRGKGIVILNQLDKIMELLTGTNYREANWVVQKYIERPLLIYKTKFDIRQWFVITDWAPLTVWFYKESYVRFCTKPFTLIDFHESVHLCNNAVQCRYTNSELRDTALPEENMWDCYTLQAYLNTIGKMDAWDKTIYPGMKQAIVGVLLASQETADVRKNCFELYGADFMLSEDLKPWLIEINSCPCMASSTSVTARLCANCLEDTIKVVLDRKEDKNADTGLFELIYKQNVAGMHTTLYGGNDLVLQGRKLSRDIDWPGIMTKYNNKRGSGSPSPPLGQLTPRLPGPNPYFDGVTFVDLVDRLRLRDEDNPTTPHAQRMIENSPGSSLQNSLRKYRVEQEQQQQQQSSSSSSEEPPQEYQNERGQRVTTALDKSGILKVRKMQTGPQDPLIHYNGVVPTGKGNNAVSYSEMYPLYSNLDGKPQNFNSFGNRAFPSKSVYGNSMVANATGSMNIRQMPAQIKPMSPSYPTVPLSLLAGQPHPTAATMTDLFRLSQNAAAIASGSFQNSIYGILTGHQQQQQQQQQTPIPMMLINPLTPKTIKIKPGPSTRSAQATPMRAYNPFQQIPNSSGTSRQGQEVNSQKYATPTLGPRSQARNQQSGPPSPPPESGGYPPTQF